MASINKPKYEITIKPRSHWRHLNFKELWIYRELSFIFSWRDIKVRYKQTAVGVSWAVLQPLCTVVIFSFFFGSIVTVSWQDVWITVITAIFALTTVILFYRTFFLVALDEELAQAQGVKIHFWNFLFVALAAAGLGGLGTALMMSYG